jgi:putative hydrolase
MRSHNGVDLPRYREITHTDANCDLHVHTAQTDGKARIEEILVRASELGLRRVAFTEHVRKSTAWFDIFAQEVRNTALSYPAIEVLVGCEAKALDVNGTLDVSPEILRQCDIVLGSVHRFPANDGGYVNVASLSAEETQRIEFSLAMGLLEAGPIDVLSHPGGMYARRFERDLPPELQKALMERALDRGVAIEINSSYLQEPSRFLELCALVNPPVSIGSDMHDLKDLGSCRDMLMAHIGRQV